MCVRHTAEDRHVYMACSQMPCRIDSLLSAVAGWSVEHVQSSFSASYVAQGGAFRTLSKFCYMYMFAEMLTLSHVQCCRGITGSFKCTTSTGVFICDGDHESLDMHRCQCFKHRFCSDKCVGTYGFKTFGEFLTAPCSDRSGLSEIARNAS